MSHLVGTTAIDRFTVLTSEGDVVTLETFTSDAAFDPGGSPIDWEVSELGAGLYQVTWPITAEGSYYLRLLGDSTSQVFEFTLATDDPDVEDTITHYFTILDDDGAYYSTAVVTIEAAYDPGGSPFVPIIEALGNGLYRVTWPPDAGAGVYTLRLHADLSAIGDDPQRFEFETRVLDVVVVESPFVAVYGPTLDDLIRGIAVACRDYYAVRATGNAGDGTTWPDRQRLAARPPKMFKGSSLFVTSSAQAENLGVEVHVADSVNGALTLDPTLPAPVRIGDRAYLTNLESSGFARDTYIEEVNAQINAIFPECVRAAVWTFPDTFDGDYPWLTPPPEFTHIYAVSYPNQGWTQYDTAIPSSHEVGEMVGWWWDEAMDRMVIGGDYRGYAAGQYITIRGYGRWTEITEPDDTTGIAYEWLREACAGQLILSLRDPRRQSEAAMHTNKADALRIKVGTRFPPNTIRIR